MTRRWRPADLTGPATVLTRHELDRHHHRTPRTIGSLLVHTSAATLASFGVAPDANAAADVAKTACHRHRWPEHPTRLLVEDVARRLAWLTDPTPDEAICDGCGRVVVAPRADLAAGDAHCTHCDTNAPFTLPDPILEVMTP